MAKGSSGGMVKAGRVLFLGGLCAIPLVALPATPAPAPPAAADAQEIENARLWNANPAPSDPRDFQGVWWLRRLFRGARPLTGAPLEGDGFDQLVPMTALQIETKKRRVAAARAGRPLVQASADCLPHGAPRIMFSGYPFQISYGPGVMVFLHEVTHDVRIIHMDGQPPPADEPATFMGYSRGHWDGATLIVETDHLNDRTSLDEEGLSHGARMKVREEFTRFVNKYGGAEMRELITIDDPEYYTRPWSTEKLFTWRGNLELSEYSCEENNRNQSADGVTVAR